MLCDSSWPQRGFAWAQSQVGGQLAVIQSSKWKGNFLEDEEPFVSVASEFVVATAASAVVDQLWFAATKRRG
jgi:hypothetical protein